MTEGKQALLARVLREAGRPADVPALLARLRSSAETASGEPAAVPGEGLGGDADAPLPLAQYQVTYDYSEDVEGVSRRFLHQTVLEAAGLQAARAAALAHFEQLERLSGVGWKRTLMRYHVAEVTTRGLPS